MMLKFLVDVGVGRRVEEDLCHRGYDVSTVRSLNPRMEIIRLAVSEGRMIITMDKDFGELVYRRKQAHSGVLLLRMEEATGQEKVAAIAQVLNEYSAQIQKRFCVYQKGILRIRRKEGAGSFEGG